MTDTTAADHRRATALVVHYGHQDRAGVDAVVAEAAEAHRVPQLVAALIDLHTGIAGTLYTDDGLVLFADLLAGLAAGAGDDLRGAASLVVAVIRDDDTPPPDLADTLADDTPATLAALLTGLLAVYRHTIPVLYTPLGLSVLQRNTVGWAAREDDDEAGQR